MKLFFWLIVLLGNEFLIPNNIYIPKIYQIIDSLVILSMEYQLVVSFLSTITVTYLVISALYFILIAVLPNQKAVKSVLYAVEKCKFNNYFTLPFLTLILAVWFPKSYFVQWGILIFFVLHDLVFEIMKKYPGFCRNKIEPVSIILNKSSELITKLNREFIIVNGFNVIRKRHTLYFSLLIVIEFFLSDSNSIGHLLKISYEYWSVQFLTAIVVIIILLIWLLDYLFSIIKERGGMKYEN